MNPPSTPVLVPVIIIEKHSSTQRYTMDPVFPSTTVSVIVNDLYVLCYAFC